jgi:hypothetical protein
MPIPALATAAAIKIPAALKALFASKHFITALLGAGYLTSTGLGAYGQAGERGLAREQMGMQEKLGLASAEATKRGVKESRARTKEYMKTLMKTKREDVKEARDLQALQSYTQSQDRQMALVIQAMQALSQKQGGAATAAPGGGMLGLMEGGF